MSCQLRPWLAGGDWESSVRHGHFVLGLAAPRWGLSVLQWETENSLTTHQLHSSPRGRGGSDPNTLVAVQSQWWVTLLLLSVVSVLPPTWVDCPVPEVHLSLSTVWWQHSTAMSNSAISGLHCNFITFLVFMSRHSGRRRQQRQLSDGDTADWDPAANIECSAIFSWPRQLGVSVPGQTGQAVLSSPATHRVKSSCSLLNIVNSTHFPLQLGSCGEHKFDQNEDWQLMCQKFSIEITLLSHHLGSFFNC